MTRSVAVVVPRWAQHHGVHGEEHSYRTFDNVVRAVSSVSPLVEVQEVGVVIFAAKGPSRYFGGDCAVAELLHRTCADVDALEGLEWGVGVADSRFAALAAARLAVSRARPCVIDSAATADFVDALPVRALSDVAHVSAHTVSLFVRLGLTTCGAVRSLGEPALVDRFGFEGREVHRLVSVIDPRPLSPVAPPADFAVAVDFDTPLVSAVAVVATVRPVVDQLVQSVSEHGMQCVRILVVCSTDHAETSARVWGEPRGFSAQGIASRIAVQAEGWMIDASADPDAPTAGVVRVELVPLECREVLAVQAVLWGGHQENTERAARAVAMATAVDAAVCVSVPRWEGGRDIGAVFGRVPATHVDLHDADAARRRVHDGEGVARRWSGSVPRPSPACIFDQPRPADVLDAGGRTVGVTGRHEFTAAPVVVNVGGRSWRVQRATEPWPVEERWWDPRRRRRHVRMQALVRDTEGRTGVFLLGLEGGHWFLLARYD